MDAETLVGALVILAVILWIVWPYVAWRQSSSQALEAHVARTSFPCGPGELVPPAWRQPELELSVVIPAYNEEYRLPHMLNECLMYLEARSASNPGRFSYEVLVIDDGSRDSTYEAALRCSLCLPSGRLDWEQLRVIRLVANRGKGFAVRMGVLAARGRLILIADADGATRIADVELLERALRPSVAIGTANTISAGGMPYRNFGDYRDVAYGASRPFYPASGAPEIAFGSRHHLREEISARRSPLQNILDLGFEGALWVLVGGPIHDMQCGFKLIHAAVAKQLFSAMHLHRWSYDLELVLLARLFGKQIAEVPVTWVQMPGSKHLSVATSKASILRDVVLTRCLYLVGLWRASALA